jgi:hypothetical protein
MRASGCPVASIANHQEMGLVFITTGALLIHSSSASTTMDLSANESKKRAEELDSS